MDSILNSVKKAIGPSESDTYFDDTLIMHINSVFMILDQIGFRKPGFRITGASETWSDYLDDSAVLEMVKSYMYMKVKMLFDPPSTGILKEALAEQIAEFEWRLNVAVDTEALEAVSNE